MIKVAKFPFGSPAPKDLNSISGLDNIPCIGTTDHDHISIFQTSIDEIQFTFKQWRNLPDGDWS